MIIRIAIFVGFFSSAVALAGVGAFGKQERAAWRGEAEEACVAAGQVKPTTFVRPLGEIAGQDICGVDHAFRVLALADGAVSVQPSARLGCAMTAALDLWVRDSVQPAARARFGVEVAEIRNAGSYACRKAREAGEPGLSEHAFGNGIDVAAFILADGREIPVAAVGDPAAAAFLDDVRSGACGTFRTVSGPGADGSGDGHLHLDLARYDADGRVTRCGPRPAEPAGRGLAPPADDHAPEVSSAPRLDGGAPRPAADTEVATGSVTLARPVAAEPTP